MNRMKTIFADMKTRGEKATILYFPIGDPLMGDSVELAKTYFNVGCTVLEIGLPYENPCLDGPTVANSMARALEVVDLEKVFEIIKNIRKECPNNILQVFTYYENVAKYGAKEFAKKCYECGADALLTPNATLEQLKELDEELKPYDLINLRFKPYNLSEEDLKDCAENAEGYIFSQAVNGSTGARDTVDPHIAENVKLLKESGTRAIIIPGFGISNAEQGKEVINMGADGFCIGSATIKHFEAGDGKEFIESLYKVCQPK